MPNFHFFNYLPYLNIKSKRYPHCFGNYLCLFFVIFDETLSLNLSFIFSFTSDFLRNIRDVNYFSTSGQDNQILQKVTNDSIRINVFS